jgi:hypothetical protein
MEHRLHYVGLELADRLAITNIRHSIFGPDHA